MKKFVVLFTLLSLFRFSYSQVSTDNHSKALAYLDDAQGLLQNEQYNEAALQLEQALELDPSLRDAYQLLFTASFHTRDTETPKRYLKQAKTIFKEDDEMAYYLGKVYQLEKDYDQAINEFSDALAWCKPKGDDYPMLQSYYASRGSCYLMQYQSEKALADFDYVIQLNDSNAAAYANRGFALHNLNRPIEACDSWIKAYDLGLTETKRYLDKYCQ